MGSVQLYVVLQKVAMLLFNYSQFSVDYFQFNTSVDVEKCDLAVKQFYKSASFQLDSSSVLCSFDAVRQCGHINKFIKIKCLLDPSLA